MNHSQYIVSISVAQSAASRPSPSVHTRAGQLDGVRKRQSTLTDAYVYLTLACL